MHEKYIIVKESLLYTTKGHTNEINLYIYCSLKHELNEFIGQELCTKELHHRIFTWLILTLQ